ncbi:MAG: hypothetical protein ACKV0T_07025 [Planctomycetales bacterium]
MRIVSRIVFGSVLIAASALIVVDAAPAEPVRYGLPDVRFEGLKHFDSRQILAGLEINFDLALATRRQSNPDEFASALESAVLNGYLKAGFATAHVVAHVDDDREQVVVRVSEGWRFLCGDIDVVGANRVASEVIVRHLTEPAYPLEATPISLAKNDGTQVTIWVDSAGGLAKSRSPIWSNEKAAPFDQITCKDIRERIFTLFEAHGYYNPRFEVAVEPVEERQTATLLVTIADEGPRGVITEIDIKGAERFSEASLLEYLGVAVGTEFDGRMPARLQRRLRESGRYERYAISETVVPDLNFNAMRLAAGLDVPEGEAPSILDRPSNQQGIKLSIHLVEASAAPQLADPLSPVEEALLKGALWLERWSLQVVDQELAVEVDYGPFRPDHLLPSASVRMWRRLRCWALLSAKIWHAR